MFTQNTLTHSSTFEICRNYYISQVVCQITISLFVYFARLLGTRILVKKKENNEQRHQSCKIGGAVHFCPHSLGIKTKCLGI